MPAIAPLRAVRPDARRVDLAAATWSLGEPRRLGLDAVRAHLADGSFVRDPVPALYHCEVTFGPPDERRHATGFLARMAIDTGEGGGDGGTRAAAGHDAEPVVYRYEDPRGWVDEILSSNAFDEVARFTDGAGNEHRLWRVDRPEGVGEVVAQFEDRPLRLESGTGLLREAQAHWHTTGRETDGSVLVLLAPEGPGPAPWRAGWVLAPFDEARPRPWTEQAGDPGKAQWRMPTLD